MSDRAGGFFDHRATPVSADDVARVVNRAWAERAGARARIRLTSGQRLAILNRRLRTGATGAARA